MISFSLLLLFPRRSDGSATAHATVDVLLFLFGWFQDLRGGKLVLAILGNFL